jgi:hypothetical protein
MIMTSDSAGVWKSGYAIYVCDTERRKYRQPYS